MQPASTRGYLTYGRYEDTREPRGGGNPERTRGPVCEKHDSMQFARRGPMFARLPLRRLPLRRPLSSAAASASDPYALLGVRQGAPADELKAAYRLKALENHPDRNPEDREAAEQRFKAMSEAYYAIADGQSRVLTAADAEDLFHEVFGPDGQPGLAWRVKGRSNTPKEVLGETKGWQHYQKLIDSQEDTRLLSGLESRNLYRDLLRALRGVEPTVASSVRESARSLFAEHAAQADVALLRTLIVDGRHQLEAMREALDVAQGGWDDAAAGALERER
eukprot:2887715-Prymnesium_polylepis.2